MLQGGPPSEEQDSMGIFKKRKGKKKKRNT
jgi:hypothetical protein